MKYAPTIRGFVVGVALFAAVGCLGRIDTGRMHIDKTTGEEIVENFKVPKPGDANFVGPVAPSNQAERSARADADLDRTIVRVSEFLIWTLILTGVGLIAFSFLAGTASLRAAAMTGVGIAGVILARHMLLKWGVWISNGVLLVGIPFILWNVWHNCKFGAKVRKGEAKPSPTLGTLLAKIKGALKP